MTYLSSDMHDRLIVICSMCVWRSTCGKTCMNKCSNSQAHKCSPSLFHAHVHAGIRIYNCTIPPVHLICLTLTVFFFVNMFIWTSECSLQVLIPQIQAVFASLWSVSVNVCVPVCVHTAGNGICAPRIFLIFFIPVSDSITAWVEYTWKVRKKGEHLTHANCFFPFPPCRWIYLSTKENK